MKVEIGQKVKAKIHVSSDMNRKYFGGKLPTYRDGFCNINRVATIIEDQNGVWTDGDYATIVVDGKPVVIIGGDGHWEIK